MSFSPAAPGGRSMTWITIGVAALVLSAAMGVRQTFGLFIGPFSFDRGLPVTLVALAIALHNLVWGMAQPFAGAAADRYGTTPVVAFGAAIALFVLVPTSGTSVVVFAAAMGLTWLGTVPLTSNLIAGIFGTRYLGTLFGVVFLSHQVGSFFGAWLGGYVFDATGSYSLIWAATAIASLIAALLHFPIDDGPAGAARGGCRG